jgi:hypothetical protein
MKARILLLVGSVILGACKEPQASSQKVVIASPSPTSRSNYLLRRLAVATEESLYGLEAGSEIKVIDEHAGRLLVETHGVRFEINRGDATSDPGQAEMLRARTQEQKANWQLTRLRNEDQRFLAEDNIRRRSARMQVAQPRRAIDSDSEEIAGLESESAPRGSNGIGEP